MSNFLNAIGVLLLLLALTMPLVWRSPAEPVKADPAKQELAKSEPTKPAPAKPETDKPGPAKLVKLAVQHLPNAIRVHPHVISGGLPEGDEAFAELRDLGVKTVISVDGMAPDVATAKKYGLRYVHLPHGYDGIPAARIAELSAAVETLPAPVYIHCHHGKHRSPAASAAACVGAGLLAPADSLAVLKLAGTSPHYTGLFHDVAAARRLPPTTKTSLEFPETSPVPQLVSRMVQIEHWQAALTKALKSPPSKTETAKAANKNDRENPAATALLLREQFTELLRDEDNKKRPTDYVQLLQESETAAQRLEMYLAREDADLSDTAQRDEASKLLLEVSNRCATCHKAYRDPAGSR